MAKAGSAIPVKFGLGGSQGLRIFASRSPGSQRITCDLTAPLNPIEQTVTANQSGLTYDSSSGRYTYVWKTVSAWAGSCRQLLIELNDGSYHRANFKFK